MLTICQEARLREMRERALQAAAAAAAWDESKHPRDDDGRFGEGGGGGGGKRIVSKPEDLVARIAAIDRISDLKKLIATFPDDPDLLRETARLAWDRVITSGVGEAKRLSRAREYLYKKAGDDW